MKVPSHEKEHDFIVPNKNKFPDSSNFWTDAVVSKFMDKNSKFVKNGNN